MLSHPLGIKLQAASSLSPQNSSSVPCPRRFLRDKTLNFCTCFVCPCPTGNVFLIFFRQIFVFLVFLGVFGLRIPHFRLKKKTWTVRQGHIKHVCLISGSYLSKTAWTFGPLCGKHAKIAASHRNYRLVQIERPKLCPREFLTPFFRVRPRNFAHIFWKAVSKTRRGFFFNSSEASF